MIINRLRIENYRNFKVFEIELKPFTLIIGENNIGKTNLLNAIGLILSQEITFFKKRNLEIDDINYQAKRDFKEDLVNNVDIAQLRKVEVKIEITLSNFNNIQESVVGDWFIDPQLNQAKLTYISYFKEDLTSWVQQERTRLGQMTKNQNESPEDFLERKIQSISFPIQKYSYKIFGGVDETKQIDFYFLKMLKYEFLDALRDAKTQLVASGDYRLLYKILSNRGAGRYDEIREVLTELDRLVKQNLELNSVKTEVAEYLKKTSLVEDEAQNAIDFQFSEIEENEILKKLSMIYGNAPVTVDRNGLGRNNLLYISLILSHLIGRNNSETCFRLIAIEEPESHLHPVLQKHLAANLENEVDENLQIIVTSHSTHITSHLDLENTVVVFNSGENVAKHYVLDGFKDASGKINADDKSSITYLRKYLSATKSTMFFSRRVILVEGISEEILIPRLFRLHTGKSIEKAGITILNVNGVSFKHFLKVIANGFFLKCLVITDSDSDTQVNQRASDLQNIYQNPFPEIIRISISNQSTFEKDLIEANTTGIGKDILAASIQKTRPQSGKTYIEGLGVNPIAIDDYFSLIVTRDANGKKTKDYKSAFASDLESTLSDPAVDSSQFIIPEYIIEGFDFLYPSE